LIGETKRVWVGDKQIETKAVIISTGASSKMLGLGEEKWMGRGVSTCAVCDAAFFKEKIAVVVGGGDAAMEDALALAKYASEVYLIHRRDSFKASKIMQERVKINPKIKIIWKSEVVEVRGSGKLEGIKIKNVETGVTTDIVADGLFLAIGHFPQPNFRVVDLDEKVLKGE
jgi:thioredoxin reductase (NADPH)